MTQTEKQMLATLLAQYQTEQKAAAQQNTAARTGDSTLAELLKQGYTLVPPNQQSQVQQTTQPQGQQNDFDTMMRMMMSSMQTFNAQTMQQPQAQTIEDVVAQIINPPIPDFGHEPNGAQFTGGGVNGK